MVLKKPTLCFASIAIRAAWAQQDAEEEVQFRFPFVGPKVGNRIAVVAGVPSDASTYCAGAASGGNDYIVLILM